MHKTALVLALAVTLAVGTATAQARPTLTKPQYVAKANAICKQVIADLKPLVRLYPRTRAARVGDKWLAIDRQALRKLRALSAPPADRATVRKLLALADTAINKGIVEVVRAAKSGSNPAYNAAVRRAQKMLDQAERASRSYGLVTCARWAGG